MAVLAVVAVEGMRRLRDVRDAAPGLFVPARLPVAIAAVPDGGFRYGEQRTGRVYEIGADGRPKGLLAELEVATNENLGLLGIAVDESGSRTFASWAEGVEGRLQVSELTPGGPRLVWQGPLLGGGSVAPLAWSPQGRLVLGIVDPGASDGRIVSLDPDGPQDQVPSPVSSGWLAPAALSFDDSARLWVADQPPARLRVARGDDPSQAPAHSTTEDGALDPRAMAVEVDGDLLVCAAGAGTLQRFSVGADGRPALAATSGIAPCEHSVAVLADERIAVGSANGIRVVVDPGTAEGIGAEG